MYFRHMRKKNGKVRVITAEKGVMYTQSKIV